MSETFRVVLTGGGSGGHIYPLLAVADELDRKAAALGFVEERYYVGPHDSYAPLFAARDIASRNILAGKLRRYASFQNILDIPKVLIGFVQALWQLYLIMPDVIFSKGGPGALPVVVAGWFYRVPVVIHESDAVPGLTNRWSARFAKKIFLSFADAADGFGRAAAKTEVTGAPVRRELIEHRSSPEAAKESLGFEKEKPLLLILGGSQGSIRINEFILEYLPQILAETQILHQTGVANFADVEKLARAMQMDAPFTNRYQPVNYFTDTYEAALSAADVVLGRAGSGVIFEGAAFGKPEILIPLPDAANDHQRANAYAFAKAGGGIVIEEANLLPGLFLNELKKILGNHDAQATMGNASASFFKPGGAETIAETLLKTAM